HVVGRRVQRRICAPEQPRRVRRLLARYTREAAEVRGRPSLDWTFPMVSHEGTTFAEDMGYRQDGGWMPGVSVFRRQSGGIVRVSDAPFSPGDDFCSAWHFFDLIPEGAAGWQPKYKYG